MNPYQYFSLIFSYPTAELLNDIRERSRSEDFADFHSHEGIGGISVEEAQAEYTRLFISAYPALLCPPYESFYREGILYGQSSIETGEWYEKSGLRFACEGEPADLLSVELDFLALTNDGLFLARMKEWVFGFIERVKQHSTLYGPCAMELETFLQQVTDAELSTV
jgi:nitrate reductase assembly molybdenum cofactor insertion protein NarJ